MDVVGSEIGHKMRSAIKAKLTELGCYVDDELPDYVMVMVANKRTRSQMEEDLQLFLGDNTELFVNWLHQVLKKLQEVTVTNPLHSIMFAEHADVEKNKERSSSKEKKSKTKKDNEKTKKKDSSKKSKKKDKHKHKKVEKKSHKKKKSKHHEMIRPNVPPLLMNMEKDSEPSITDVFAGQILKNHGVLVEDNKNDMKSVDKKPEVIEIKKPFLPIIDPATITQPEDSQSNVSVVDTQEARPSVEVPNDQVKEINEIEAKIQGLKQKLADQLDSMSDDEDFLNIRTEAEELMNDFAEDVLQEISQQNPTKAPITKEKSPNPPQPFKPPEPPEEPQETLPQIELNLPKRPVRERLGTWNEKKIPEKEKEIKDKWTDSPERFTPDREPDVTKPTKSAKSRLGDPIGEERHSSDSIDKPETSSKRLTSKVSVLEPTTTRSQCLSVVRVRPRPRAPAVASNLLLRAVADAHKSLRDIPPKVDIDGPKIKRALVLPMRRCVDAQKIVIQVPASDRQVQERSGSTGTGDESGKISDSTKEEYTPSILSKRFTNTDYVQSRIGERRTSTKTEDSLVIETINIHNPTVDKEKNTQFIVTMDGFNPNAFLTKKLMTEGLLDNDDMKVDKPKESQTVLKIIRNEEKKSDVVPPKDIESENKKEEEIISKNALLKKRLSDTSDESDTQVIIKKEDLEKRKNEVSIEEPLPVKKKRASTIVYNVADKEQVRERERTESASSDNHVTVTTNVNSHKYDQVPPLSLAERKLVACRSFPLCRYGNSCAFQHPACKFGASCSRRGCVYSHPATHSVIASQVVPVANYKTISPATLPSICKFFPNCVNPACHFYHPKPCRYGKACLNKIECNFYHSDVPTGKWRYPV